MRAHQARAAAALTAAAVLVLLAGLAAADGRARTFASADGVPLSAPSGVAPEAAAAAFLASGRVGKEGAELKAVRVVRGKRGLTHVRFEQYAGGLRVAGAFARVALAPDGSVVHALEGLAPAPVAAAAAAHSAALAPAPEPTGGNARGGGGGGVGEAAAVATAKAFHGYGPGQRYWKKPSAKRVLAWRPADGALVPAWEVTTWTLKTNRLHLTYVDQETGTVLYKEKRSSNLGSFKVFVPSPLDGNPQTTVNGPDAVIPKPNAPGAGDTPSPLGWLTGKKQYTRQITGNNAYIDSDYDDMPDKDRGPAVRTGAFTATADLSVGPVSGPNRDVAVQNMFYHINYIHDRLYEVGFTEEAGNFQKENFGRGGEGGDAVVAEVQDGGDVNNADFAITPGDGESPRTQMYLGQLDWTVLSAGGVDYIVASAFFGPEPNGTAGPLRVVPPPNNTACSALPNGSMTGAIAIVDRGKCSFVTKVLNAQNAGAVAVLVVNGPGDDYLYPMFPVGDDANSVAIPSVLVGNTKGSILKSADGAAAVMQTKVSVFDVSLDSGVVYHEYGHGLTWRIIDGLDTFFSGAIGEGASDTLAFLINNTPDPGPYFSWGLAGVYRLRRFPYDKYPLTYANATTGRARSSCGVHSDGEIYAAAMWRVKVNYEQAGLTRQDLLEDWVQGMFLTPPSPSFVQMRDGILAYLALAAANGTADAAARTCHVWKGFAALGLGEGAVGTETLEDPWTWLVDVMESFQVPASCGGDAAPKPAVPVGSAVRRRAVSSLGDRNIA